MSSVRVLKQPRNLRAPVRPGQWLGHGMGLHTRIVISLSSELELFQGRLQGLAVGFR